MSSTPLTLPTQRQALWQLLVLAAPLIAVSASRLLMGFIDVLMVARLGTDALAAVTPATMFVWIFIWSGMGTASSVQTFASQADGRGEPERGAEYAWQTVGLGLFSALAAWGVSHAMPTMYAWIGRLGGQTPEVLQAQIDYTTITVWSMVPAIMAGGLEGFFNGVKRPMVTLVASIVSLGVNVLFNWLFIFGPTIAMPAMTLPLVGTLPAWSVSFPAWGIWGAGLATVIGWWARLVVLIVVFVSPKLDALYRTRRAWRPKLHEMGDVLRIGVPTALMGVAEIGSWVVFLNLIAPHYGTPALAATNIAMQYTHIAFMPAVGIGLALCSQVGFAVGAQRVSEAIFRTHVALRLNMIYMGLAGVFLFVARYPLLRAMSTDKAVLEVGAWIMLWVSLYQVFDAMSITYIFSLRGAGDTKAPAILSAACCWILFVGGSYALSALAPQLGIHGAWFMAVAYLTALGLLLWWRFRSGVWQKIEVFGASCAAAAQTIVAATADAAPVPGAAALDCPELGAAPTAPAAALES
jgi:MATE family multidrug resistance protein